MYIQCIYTLFRLELTLRLPSVIPTLGPFAREFYFCIIFQNS